MASNRKNPILPTGNTTSIAIYSESMEALNDMLWSKKLKDFFINGKFVKGKEVIFEIRSMRVNEFVDLLDGKNIPWRDIKEKYK